MAYTDDVAPAPLHPTGHYLDVADASEVLGIGRIICISAAGAYRHALAANTTDIVRGVCTERFRANAKKRITEGRFMFALDDAGDAVLANVGEIVRAVTSVQVTVDPAATGPICGVVDEFRGSLAVVRFDFSLIMALNHTVALIDAIP
jgi:hypothetical protein